jgi:hypothetical protein
MVRTALSPPIERADRADLTQARKSDFHLFAHTACSARGSQPRGLIYRSRRAAPQPAASSRISGRRGLSPPANGSQSAAVIAALHETEAKARREVGPVSFRVEARSPWRPLSKQVLSPPATKLGGGPSRKPPPPAATAGYRGTAGESSPLVEAIISSPPTMCRPMPCSGACPRSRCKCCSTATTRRWAPIETMAFAARGSPSPNIITGAASLISLSGPSSPADRPRKSRQSPARSAAGRGDRGPGPRDRNAGRRAVGGRLGLPKGRTAFNHL